MSSKVSLARCEDYQEQDLDDALSTVVGQLGGWEQFVQPGQTVLIKPNFIAPRRPDVPAQTDGRLIAVIAKQLNRIGAKVLVGDSTAWGSAKKNAMLAGLDKQALDAAGAELVEFNQPCKVIIQTPQGPRKVHIDRTVLEVDRIINVPKLKAHQQLVLSGALKNPFGAVPGKRKAWWHCRYGKIETFTDMIVGVYQKIAPVLNIIDGVTAMQGRGPINGKLKKVGLLLASTDAAAIDRVACEILGIKPQDVPILIAAKRAGAGATELDDIELIGPDLESLRIEGFVIPELMPLQFTPWRVCQSIARQIRILYRERQEAKKANTK